MSVQRNNRVIPSLILLFILSTAPSVEAEGDCQKFCPTTSQNDNITEYHYKYESTFNTHVSEHEYVGLHMSATVTIQQIDQCYHVLKLSKVDLRESTGAKEHVSYYRNFKRMLEMEDLSFARVEGTITHIWSSSNQLAWVLNVKRAILSNFQTRTDEGLFEEEDVNGRVLTEYKDLGDGVMMKEKDLSLYDFRYRKLENDEYFLMLTSRRKCFQKLRDGFMESSNCSESHSYDPFHSQEATNATVKAVSSVVFLSKQNTTLTVSSNEEKTIKPLTYDYGEDDAPTVDLFKEAQQTLIKLGDLDQSKGIKPETTILFLQLVKQLKTFSKHQFTFFVLNDRSPKRRSYYWDALPMVGSAEALSYMKDIFQKVDEAHQSSWITSIASIKKPSLEAVMVAEWFLENNFLEACLPYSIMYNNYIRQTSSDKEALKHIPFNLSLLVKRVYEDNEEIKRAVCALKALGNMGELDEQVLNRMYEILKYQKDEIKVHALKALRRQKCAKLNLEYLTSVFLDKQHDSEVRINAYLQRIRCLDVSFVGVLESSLRNNETNQVGSFVWTHLFNLDLSHSPFETNITTLLENVQVDLNLIKYSRNIHWSYFNQKRDMGTMVDSNVLWSEKSFIPRNANFDLNVNLFGRKMDLLNFDLQLRNTEKLIEKYLSGYPQQSTPKEQTKVNEVALALHDTKHELEREDSSLIASLRVFGDEIMTSHIISIENFISELSSFKFLVQLSKERNFDVVKNFKILDSSFTIPSLLGLPLKFHVEAAASLGFKMSGKIDLSGLLYTPPRVSIQGDLRPSGVVDLIAELGIDSNFIKSGLKLMSRIKSNTAISTKFTKKGSHFSMDWGTPDNQAEIISLQAKLYMVNDKKEVEKQPEQDQINYNKCFAEKLTYQLSGMHFCVDFTRPSIVDSYTSVAPFAASFYAKKVDTINNYHMEFGYIQSETDPTTNLFFDFDTPGSQLDRRFSFKYHRNTTEINSILLLMRTPWKSLSLSGGFSAKENYTEVKAEMLIDETARYALEGKVETESLPHMKIVKPQITLTWPGIENFILKGFLQLEKERMVCELEVLNLEKDPIVFTGLVTYDYANKSYGMSLKLISHFIKLSSLSDVAKKEKEGEDLFVVQSANFYQVKNGPKHSFVFSFNELDYTTSSNIAFKTELKSMSSQFPLLTFSAKTDFSHDYEGVKFEIDIGRNAEERLIINFNGFLDIQQDGHQLGGGFKLKAPYKGVNWSAVYKHIRSPGGFEADSSLVYDDEHKVEISIIYKNLDDYIELQGALEIPHNIKFRMFEKIEKVAYQSYAHHFLATLEAGLMMSTIEIPGFYNIENEVHNFEASLKFNLLPPLKLTAAFKPLWHDLKLKVSVEYDENIYGAEGNFYLDNSNGSSLSGNLAVQYLEYHPQILISGRMSSEGSCQVKVLLAFNQNNSYSFESRFLKSPHQPKLFFIINWPNNEISLDLNLKLSGSETYNLNAVGELKSTLSGFETLNVNFDLSSGSLDFYAALRIDLPEEKYINGHVKFNLYNYSLDVEIETPFEESRKLALTTWTTVNNAFLHRSSFILNQEFFIILIDAKKFDPTNYYGNIKFQSSNQIVNSLSANANITIRKEDSKIDLILTLPELQRFLFRTIFMYSEASKTSRGGIEVEIPYIGLPKQYIGYDLDYKNESIKFKVDIYLVEEVFRLNLNSFYNYRNDGNYNVRLDFNTESALAQFNNIYLSINHVQNIALSTYTTQLNGRFNDVFSGNFYNFVKYVRGDLLNINVNIMFKMENEYKIYIYSKNKILAEKYQSITDYDLPVIGQGKVVQEYIFEDLNSLFMNIKLILVPTNELVINAIFSTNMRDNLWQSESRLSYFDQSIFNSSTKIYDLKSDKRIIFQLNTINENLKDMLVDGTVTIKDNNFMLSGYVRHNMLPKPINLQAYFTLQDSSFTNLQVNLDSPFDFLEKFSLDLTYNYLAYASEHRISLKLNLNQQNVTLSSIHFLPEVFKYRTENYIEISGLSEKILFRGSYFFTTTQLKFLVKFQTPLQQLRLISSEMNVQVPLPQHLTSFFSFNYNQYFMNTSLKIDNRIPQIITTNVTLLSNIPYLGPNNYQSVSGPPTNQALQTHLYDLVSEVTLSGNVEIVLKTPFENNTQISFFLYSNKNDGNYFARALLKIGERTFEGTVQVKYSESPSWLLQLNFPLDPKLYLYSQHNGNWKNFRNTFQVSYENYTFNGNTYFILGAEKAVVNSEIISNLENFKKSSIIFDYTHKNSLLYFFMKVSQLTLIMNKLTKSNGTTYQAKLTTPFNELRELDINAVQSYTSTHQSISSKIQIVGLEIYILDVSSSIPINDPYNRFSFESVAKIPSSNIIITSKLEGKMIAGAVDATAYVTTPFQHHTFYRASLVHRFGNNQIDTIIQAYVADQETPIFKGILKGYVQSFQNIDLKFNLHSIININSAVKLFDWQRFNMFLNMEFPFTYVNNVAIESGYSLVHEDLDLIFKSGFNYTNQPYSTELILSYRDGIKISYGIETPIQNYEKFLVSLIGRLGADTLELGAASIVTFLPIPPFRFNHLTQGNLLNFVTNNFLYFQVNNQLISTSAEASLRYTTANNNEFNLAISSSFDVLRFVKFRHESIFETTRGELEVLYDTDKQAKFDYNMNNRLSDNSKQDVQFHLSTNQTYINVEAFRKKDHFSYGHGFHLNTNKSKVQHDFSYEYDIKDFELEKQKSLTFILPGVVQLKFDVDQPENQMIPRSISVKSLESNEKITLENTFVRNQHKLALSIPSFPYTIELITKHNVSESLSQIQPTLKIGNETIIFNMFYKFDVSLCHMGLSANSLTYPLNVAFKSKFLNDRHTHQVHIEGLFDAHKFFYHHQIDKISKNFSVLMTTPYSNNSLNFLNGHSGYDEHIYQLIFESDKVYLKQQLQFESQDRWAVAQIHLNRDNFYEIIGSIESLVNFVFAVNYHEMNLNSTDFELQVHQNESNYVTVKRMMPPGRTDLLWERLNLLKSEFDESSNMSLIKKKIFVENLSKRLEELQSKTTVVLTPVSQAMDHFYDKIGDTKKSLEVLFEKMCKKNVLFIKDLDSALAAVSNLISDYSRKLLHSMNLLALQQKLSKLVKSMKELIVSFKTSLQLWLSLNEELYKTLSKDFTTIIIGFKDFVNNLSDHPDLLEALKMCQNVSIRGAIEKFYSLFEGILAVEEVNNAAEYLFKVMLEFSTYLEDLVSEENLQKFRNSMHLLLNTTTLKEKLILMNVKAIRLDEWVWKAYDKATEMWKYLFYFPFEIPSLSFFIHIYDYWDHFYGKLSSYIETFGEVLEYWAVMDQPDSFYSVLPFQFSATVTNMDHYRTFDGRMFSFNGKCSYLLARDFGEKLFAWYLAYKIGRPMFYVVVIEGKKIEIHKDGGIVIDGENKQLPQIFEYTTLVRMNENEIFLNNARGFSFKYDLAPNIMSLKTSGWMHGRVKGLLGWGDNEPFNDLVLSNGTFVLASQQPNEDGYVKNWELSRGEGACPPITPTSPPKHQNDYANKICSELFDNTDPENYFFQCYHVVNPRIYLQMCLADMTSDPQPTKACAAATTYHHDCKHLHVYVRLPSLCVQCKGISNTYNEGQSLMIETDARRADVVFVMQEGSCNAFNSVFSQIVLRLNRTFSEKNMDARYALVVYGLHGKTPLFKTVQNQVFTTARRMAEMMLETVETDPKADGLAAIDYANRVTFRPGAIKSLIYVPCGSCLSSPFNPHIIDLYASLDLHDIALHFLHPSPFSLPANTSVKVYGLNKQQAFLRGQTKAYEAFIRPYIKPPQDQCIPLHEVSQGSVFSTSEYFRYTKNVQIDFLSRFVQVVAEKEFVCQECVCVADSVSAGRSMCNRCYTKEWLHHPRNQQNIGNFPNIIAPIFTDH